MEEQAKARKEEVRLMIVVLGLEGVGKSALVIRFVADYFNDEDYDPSIEDSYLRKISFEDLFFASTFWTPPLAEITAVC